VHFVGLYYTMQLLQRLLSVTLVAADRRLKLCLRNALLRQFKISGGNYIFLHKEKQTIGKNIS